MPELPGWRYEEPKVVVPRLPRPTHTVLKGATIFTAEKTGSVIPDGFVEVENDKITAVGRVAELGTHDGGVNIVNASGKTIVPGFFNNHAHLGWDGANDLAHQSIYDDRAITSYKAAANMIRSLQAGVTTVRDLGMHDCGLWAKQAVEQRIFEGPRLLVCGEAIVQTGGHTFWCCREASGPDEMRRAVREQVRGGADLIKIMGGHDRIEFTDEELAAVIDEAHRNGLPITAHATFDAMIRRVVEFGVDTVEHGGSLSDDTMEALLDSKAHVVTTFSPLVLQAQEGHKWGMPTWKVEERKQRLVTQRDRFDDMARAADAGVPIAFGTDAGSPAVPHNAIAPELKFMVEIGVCKTNRAALESITRVSAEMNRLDDVTGTITVGKSADLVVLGGNPLDDLSAVELVEGVWLRGVKLV